MKELVKNEILAQSAYDDGDYSRAARLAESDELRGCSLILLGAIQDGLALIEGNNSPRARYHEAYAKWVLGDAATAASMFGGIENDTKFGKSARLMNKFIRQGKIRILFQGRDEPGCPDYDIVGALRRIPYVDLVTIGYSDRADIRIDYLTTLDEVLSKLPSGWLPDMYVSHLVEDNPPPIGIENAPFPTIAHTQDYDRHVHQCYHYLKLFDAIIALGSTDYDDIHNMSNVPTFVFPLVLGVDVSNIKPEGMDKPNDIFISGTLFSNTHGKSKSVFKIAQMPEKYRIKLIDGFVNSKEYYSHLSEAKVTYTHVNRWGVLNGRAIEAISVGTCALCQNGGELGFFLSEEDGAVPYDEDNYLEVMERVLDEWDTRYAEYARRGSKKVHEIFRFKTCIQRYLHFLAHVAGQMDKNRPKEIDPVFSKIRYPSRSPWRIYFHFPSMTDLLRLQDQFRQSLSHSREYHCMDAVGESYLYSAISIKRMNLDKPEMINSFLAAALSSYHGLVEAFPDRLAAWFNLGRVCYQINELETAKAVFEAILANQSLKDEPNDLLFWREFQDDLFDYDRMMEEMVANRKDRYPIHLRKIEKAIRESVAFYLSQIHMAEGKGVEALAVLSLNVNDETRFVPIWMLRSVLNLHHGRIKEAFEDMKSALDRKEYILPKVGREFFDKVKSAGLDVSHYEKILGRVMTRLGA